MHFLNLISKILNKCELKCTLLPMSVPKIVKQCYTCPSKINPPPSFQDLYQFDHMFKRTKNRKAGNMQLFWSITAITPVEKIHITMDELLHISVTQLKSSHANRGMLFGNVILVCYLKQVN